DGDGERLGRHAGLAVAAAALAVADVQRQRPEVHRVENRRVVRNAGADGRVFELERDGRQHAERVRGDGIDGEGRLADADLRLAAGRGGVRIRPAGPDGRVDEDRAEDGQARHLRVGGVDVRDVAGELAPGGADDLR